MSDLDKISSIFNAKIDSVKNKEDLQNLKTEFFGKNGEITQQFKKLGTLESDKRKDFASNLNKIKNDLSNQIEQKSSELENEEISDKLKNEKVDVTLPIRPYHQGKIHPVSQVIDEISSIFSEIGFTVAEGPDVEAIKITLRFLSNEIRSDSLKIIIHKKKCSEVLKCKTTLLASNSIKDELRSTILRKASQFEKESKPKK